MRVVEGLPPGRTTEIIGRQLMRSATSFGANYRAACRGRSVADVISKLSIVEEEADESLYWLELLVGAGKLTAASTAPLRQEGNQIVAMTVASIKTLRSRENGRSANPKSKF